MLFNAQLEVASEECTRNCSKFGIKYTSTYGKSRSIYSSLRARTPIIQNRKKMKCYSQFKLQKKYLFLFSNGHNLFARHYLKNSYNLEIIFKMSL